MTHLSLPINSKWAQVAHGVWSVTCCIRTDDMCAHRQNQPLGPRIVVWRLRITTKVSCTFALPHLGGTRSGVGPVQVDTLIYKPSVAIRELRRLFSQYNLLNRQVTVLKNTIQEILADNGISLTYRQRGCEKITRNFGYQFMEQWCNSIAAKHQIFLG